MARFRILKSEYAGTDMDSADIWKFVFHEGYPTFKIFEEDDDTIIPSSGSGHVDIFHNLGYNPVYFAFIKADGFMYPVTTSIFVDTGTHSGTFYSQFQDENTLRIGIADWDGGSVEAGWIIMLDEL